MDSDISELYPCKTCGLEFMSFGFMPFPETGKIFRQQFCSACMTAKAEEQAGIARTKESGRRRDFWNEHCPEEFRTDEEGGKTDIIRVKTEQPLYQKAMAWEMGSKGLLLAGPSGTSKTRIAWRIIRREFDFGNSFMAMKAHRFGLEAVDLQMSGGFKDWFDRLVKTKILFLDDFGKGRFTDAVESHWFALLDERTERGRPIIVTTNSTSDELKARMSEDRGEPLIRRLRDYCHVIDFTP